MNEHRSSNRTGWNIFKSHLDYGCRPRKDTNVSVTCREPLRSSDVTFDFTFYRVQLQSRVQLQTFFCVCFFVCHLTCICSSQTMLWANSICINCKIV
jgi:hypothetical protein